MTTTTTIKRRTITLTDRPPVTIIEEEWPVIAAGITDNASARPEYRAQEAANDAISAWSIRVRGHADGRMLVYGVVDAAGYQGGGERIEDWRGGELLATSANVAAAIRRVGDAGHMPDSVMRECIADLPAEEL